MLPTESRCLRAYHRTRICLALRLRDGYAHVCGEAHYVQDPLLGGTLRLTLEDHSLRLDAEILISESNWKGTILPDTEHGCDFCFIPSISEDGDPLVQESS